MRRVIIWCVEGLPFDPRSRRAIDETLADWAIGERGTRLLEGQTIAAFTLEINERLVNMRVGEVREFRQIYARRSDGATMLANLTEFPPDTKTYTTKTINFPSPRRMVFVSEAVQSMATTFFPPSTARPRVALPRNPKYDGYTLAGNSVFFGLGIKKWVSDTSTVRAEFWEAPELGFYNVREMREWKANDGSVLSSTEKTVVSAIVGEPLAELFTVPSHYVEKPPGAIKYEVALKFYKRQPPELTLKDYQREDEIYFGLQQNRPR